jgi:hypothetical protein
MGRDSAGNKPVIVANIVFDRHRRIKLEQIFLLASMGMKSQSTGLWIDRLSWLLLIASCCYLIFSFFAYGLGAPWSDQGFIHPLRMQPPFADLRYLVANAECGVDLNDYYAGRVVGCDPSGRTYRFDYPPMSIWLGRLLHVQGSQTGLIAISTNIALVICILLILKSFLGWSWKWRLLSSALLMGYPLQQAAERGNLDVLLFLFALLLAYLISRDFRFRLAWQGLAGLLSFLLISLKLYPIFGIAGLFAVEHPAPSQQRHDLWSRLGTKLAVVIGSSAGIVATIQFLKSMGNLAKQGGLKSHGLLAMGYMNNNLIATFGLDMARNLIKVLLIVKITSLLLGFYFARKTRLQHAVAASIGGLRSEAARSFHGYLFVLMSSTWLGCYVTTINIDYRLLFLVPCLGLLGCVASAFASTDGQRSLAKVLIISMVFVFWLPILQWGYIDVAMKSIAVLEPLTEFILVPLFAGSLVSLLLGFSRLRSLG